MNSLCILSSLLNYKQVSYVQSINITGNWTLQNTILGTSALEQLGISSMNNSGNIFALSSKTHFSFSGVGTVKIYKSQNNLITQLGTDIIGISNEYLGHSTSLNESGNRIAISGFGFNNQRGRVFVYDYDSINNTWQQVGSTITKPTTQTNTERFGWSVSLNDSGDILAISAVLSDINGIDSGEVICFKYNQNNNTWEQLGQNLFGSTGFQFGTSIKLNGSGNILCVGVQRYSLTTNSREGAVITYKYNNTNSQWEQLGQILVGEKTLNEFGSVVDVNNNGNIIVSTARNHGYDATNDMNTAFGHVKVYKYNDSTNLWEQIGQNIQGEAKGDKLATSLSLNSDGTILATATSNNDGTLGAGSECGSVRIFKYNSTNNLWEQLGIDIDGERSNDSLGLIYINNIGNVFICSATGFDIMNGTTITTSNVGKTYIYI